MEYVEARKRNTLNSAACNVKRHHSIKFRILGLEVCDHKLPRQIDLDIQLLALINNLVSFYCDRRVKTSWAENESD